MANLRDRVKVSTATVGTGTVTLGPALPGFRPFANAYSANRSISYVIEDGDAWETGIGTYSTANNTLTRAFDASSSGALLNLSGTATVAVAFLSRDHPGDWPLAIISGGDPQGGAYINVGQSFTTIPLTNAEYDPFGGWSTSTNTWTVPTGQAGAYDIDGKVRFQDSTPAGISFGVGLDTTNRDSAGFFWQNTVNFRQGGFNTRTMFLNAGDQIRLFTYYDGSSAAGVISAYLRLARVR